jgi:hypothetical protein
MATWILLSSKYAVASNFIYTYPIILVKMLLFMPLVIVMAKFQNHQLNQSSASSKSGLPGAVSLPSSLSMTENERWFTGAKVIVSNQPNVSVVDCGGDHQILEGFSEWHAACCMRR